MTVLTWRGLAQHVGQPGNVIYWGFRPQDTAGAIPAPVVVPVGQTGKKRRFRLPNGVVVETNDPKVTFLPAEAEEIAPEPRRAPKKAKATPVAPDPIPVALASPEAVYQQVKPEALGKIAAQLEAERRRKRDEDDIAMILLLAS